MADALEEARAVSECESMPELIEVYEKFLQKYQKKMAELTKNQTSSWTLVSEETLNFCLLYTSPSPRDLRKSRMPSSA